MEVLDTVIKEEEDGPTSRLGRDQQHLGHMRCTKRRHSSLRHRGIRSRRLAGCIHFCKKGMSGDESARGSLN